jgi:hypothetical protein
MDRLHEALGDRLQHQAHRGVHLAQSHKLIAVEHAEVRVREHAALERALAGPDHVRGEVCVAVPGEPFRHLWVDVGLLTREHQQLLASTPGSVVQEPLDLLGRVEVRPVRGERAVLAVAAARTRERQCVVP